MKDTSQESAPRLRVALVVPAELRSMTGNAVDVERWQEYARESDIELVIVWEGAAELPPAIDLVHAIHSRRGGPDGARLAGDRLPFIASVSGSDLYLDHPKEAWRSHIEAVWRRADAIVLWHAGARADLTAIDPTLAGKLRPVNPSVLLEPARRTTRESWGAGPDDIIVALPGSLRAAKDPLFPMEALARVRREFPALRFLIAGVVRDVDYEPAVRRVLEQNRWAEFVGALPRAEVLGLMQVADVVLNTSPEEGFANSVLEAMFLGKPLLLRDNSGNRAPVIDAVQDPPPARFFRTVDEFASELAAMLRDRALLERMGRSALAHAEERFSPARERRGYHDLYRELVQAARR